MGNTSVEAREQRQDCVEDRRNCMEPPKEPPLRFPDFIDERQERIYKRLCNRISEGTASFYRDVCRLRNNAYLFDSTTHLVAHLLRDVESALRDVVLPDGYQPPVSSPIPRDAQRAHRK